VWEQSLHAAFCSVLLFPFRLDMSAWVVGMKFERKISREAQNHVRA
jgi:hypothetical protein